MGPKGSLSHQWAKGIIFTSAGQRDHFHISGTKGSSSHQRDKGITFTSVGQRDHLHISGAKLRYHLYMSGDKGITFHEWDQRDHFYMSGGQRDHLACTSFLHIILTGDLVVWWMGGATFSTNGCSTFLKPLKCFFCLSKLTCADHSPHPPLPCPLDRRYNELGPTILKSQGAPERTGGDVITFKHPRC